MFHMNMVIAELISYKFGQFLGYASYKLARSMIILSCSCDNLHNQVSSIITFGIHDLYSFSGIW